MKKHLFSLLLLIGLVFSIFAQEIPAGYYSDAVGEKGAALKTALHYIIKDADELGYGSGEGRTWSGFAKTDVRPDGTVWDMYSNERRMPNGNNAPGGMNIEHSFAKSWWGGGQNQAYKDLFHLNPSDIRANSARGSWPLGIVTGTETYGNGVIKVGKSNMRPGGEITVWEPADEYKGDFARAYMYMVTAYEDFANQWTGNSTPQLDNNTYPVFEEWAIEMLLDWTRQDSVSVKEINRNREIYKIQGNRNPYIDIPNMAEYVWGRLKDVPFTENGNVNFPYISEPYSNTRLDFGEQAYTQSDSRYINIKAQNLKSDLTVSIGGIDAASFSAPAVISKADAEQGHELQVTFAAREIGEKTAELTLSGEGLSSVTVILQALVTDDFMALPATNITSTGFTANWTLSAGANGYMLDVFTLHDNGETESEILLEEDFNSGLPAGWTSSGYIGNDENGAVRLASSSQQGAISLPELELSNAAVLTVEAKQYGSDNGAEISVTADGRKVALWASDGAYKEYTVEIPAKSETISLSANPKMRVYISHVKVETQGSKPTPVPVAGYPMELGNVLSHQVSGLGTYPVYYYRVIPVSDTMPPASEIILVDLRSSGTGISSKNKQDDVYCIVSDNTAHMYNLPEKESLQIFDLTGKLVHTAPVVSPEMQIQLPAKGMYVLRIAQSGCKIINN